jgi:transposase-like protein
MSKKVFTEKEIAILSRNLYVKSVSPKGITYSEEFKQHFISEYHKGKFPREIFEEAGFDVNIIGIKRVKSSSERWRRAYEKEGVLGLKDSRSESLDRPQKNELSLEEKNARLEAQINLLKAENELLKKIRMAERGLKK